MIEQILHMSMMTSSVIRRMQRHIANALMNIIQIASNVLSQTYSIYLQPNYCGNAWYANGSVRLNPKIIV